MWSWKESHVTNCFKRPMSKINKIRLELKDPNVGAALICRTLVMTKSRTNITILH